VNAPLTADFDLVPESVLAAITGRTKLIVICSPNNPTGNLFPLKAIEAICAGASCLVAIDEAYAEFAGQSHIPLMDRFPNVAILRTMSKWAGLAGMRVGYGLMPTQLVPFLKPIVPPFHNVGLASAEAALASLEDRGRLMEQVRAICADRDELYRALASFPELRPLPSVTNFILVRTAFADARPFVASLARRGVLIRGYGDDTLRSMFRVTVGRPEENVAFLAALRASLEETRP
jgi:histidinol-phosphate aminotransferase